MQCGSPEFCVNSAHWKQAGNQTFSWIWFNSFIHIYHSFTSAAWRVLQVCHHTFSCCSILLFSFTEFSKNSVRHRRFKEKFTQKAHYVCLYWNMCNLFSASGVHLLNSAVFFHSSETLVVVFHIDVTTGYC